MNKSFPDLPFQKKFWIEALVGAAEKFLNHPFISNMASPSLLDIYPHTSFTPCHAAVQRTFWVLEVGGSQDWTFSEQKVTELKPQPKMGNLVLSLVYLLCTILTIVMLLRNLPLAWKLFKSPHWMVRKNKHLHWLWLMVLYNCILWLFFSKENIICQTWFRCESMNQPPSTQDLRSASFCQVHQSQLYPSWLASQDALEVMRVTNWLSY